MEKLDKAKEMVEDIQGEITNIREEIVTDFDEKSDKWKEGENGEAEQGRIDSLESMDSNFDDLLGNFDDIFSNINEVTESV